MSSEVFPSTTFDADFLRHSCSAQPVEGWIFLRRCTWYRPQRRGPDFAAAPQQDSFHSDHDQNPWDCRRWTRSRQRKFDNPIVKCRQSRGSQLNQDDAKFVAWVWCSSSWRTPEAISEMGLLRRGHLVSSVNWFMLVT